MAPFHLHRATIKDTAELGHLMAAAYIDDPIDQCLMPFEHLGGYWAKWLSHDFARAGERYFKVVEGENGKIVGFAKVRYPSPNDGKEFVAEPPEGTDVELLERWFGGMDKYHAKHSSYETDYYLHVFCVHPDYQRKGIGKMMLEHWLSDTDRDGAKAYLQATTFGEGLYRLYGWEIIEDMVTETKMGPVVWKCMMREPQGKK